jgi:mannose-6-phosphate isomerase-like protein (cupin superfamily)
MRRIITGITAEGRSRVESIEEITPQLKPGDVDVAFLWATDTCPPQVPIDRPATPPLLDMGMAPGATRWMVIRMGPGYEHPDHRTDSIDWDLVLEGQADLILDAETVTLTPGDCAVLPGVAHQWRAGPQGCTLSIAMLGLEPL